jgi:phage terminase Nu1 subunit (DNA packaging protein)
MRAAPDMTGSVQGIAIPEPERYVTRAELADLMGVSERTVDRFIADGMPSETWGRRTRRFRPSVALAWARSRNMAA